MALHRPASSRAHGARTPQASWLTGDPQRHLLRPQERLSLAVAAKRLPTLEDCLRLVQAVAYRWDLGASERRAARAAAVAPWQKPEPHRRHRGLPVDQDYGSGRQRARDRKSTRLNSSHANISYAVFCLKKKTRKPRWERS